jgi:CheY-like chemotaxis protein
MSTILLVDDQPDLLELYTEVLEMMDHRVLQAHDGEEALEVAHTRRPDLVVTDWKMPRMDGVELCEHLHGDEQLSDVPIILHSSTADPHAPGVQFIPKGSSLEQFESLVSRVLSGSRVARAARCSGSQEQRAPPVEQPGGQPARGRVRSSGSPLHPGRPVEERHTWSTRTRAAEKTLHAALLDTRW